MAKSKKAQEFRELCDEYTNYIMMQFIESGGKGFKSAVWSAMAGAIQWNEERRKAEEAKEPK